MCLLSEFTKVWRHRRDYFVNTGAVLFRKEKVHGSASEAITINKIVPENGLHPAVRCLQNPVNKTAPIGFP
jgi:hypothetical protein